jgi:hypothetical protein
MSGTHPVVILAGGVASGQPADLPSIREMLHIAPLSHGRNPA